jgi:hypothetical protein
MTIDVQTLVALAPLITILVLLGRELWGVIRGK